MQQTAIKPSPCLFCKPGRQENRFLAKNLYRRIKRQICSLKHQQAVAQKTEGNGFRQLVKVLYPHLLRKSQDCHHQMHIDSFCSLLKIDSQVLDQACERVANATAETNYHLELVANQIKNVSDSLAMKRIEVEYDSDDSHPSQKKGKKKAQFVAERQVRESNTKKSAQVVVNSSDLQVNYSMRPISGSQPSISPLSQQNNNQFAFIVSYPFFPNGYAIQ